MPGDIKTKYLPSVTLGSPGAIAGSSSYTAGYISDVVNVSNVSGGPPTDILLSGHFIAPSANTNAGNLEVWVIGAERDTPTWPAGLDTTSAPTGAFTMASRNFLISCGRLAALFLADTTASRQYTFAPLSVASLFGGALPTHFRVFVTHLIATNGQNWAASGHDIYYTPILAQYT